MEKDKNLVSLLKYMKEHQKEKATIFSLKELSTHLKLNDEETKHVINKAKELKYIRICGDKERSHTNSTSLLLSKGYCITESGKESIKRTFSDCLVLLNKNPIISLITMIVTLFTFIGIIQKFFKS